jgi:hypothetical protein
MPDIDAKRATYTADFIKSDTDEAVFLGHPAIDNLMDSLVALGAEVWTNRRRMRVLEKLLEQKGVTAEMIETFMPSDEDAAAWQAERDAFIARTFAPLKRAGSKDVATDWAPGQGPRRKES